MKSFAMSFLVSMMALNVSAATVAFDGPVTCTLVQRGETATTAFTARNENSGGYWQTIVDSWYGNNFGDSGTYFGVAPIDQFRRTQPDRNAFMVWGVSEPGQPITELTVSVWASRRDFNVGGPGKFDELAQATVLRKQYPYFNLFNDTVYSENGLPDARFSAAQLQANEGVLEFQAPLLTADGKVEMDKIVCKGNDFKAIP